MAIQWHPRSASTPPGKNVNLHARPGHLVAEIRLVFRIVPPTGSEVHQQPFIFDSFLVYAQQFDVVPQQVNNIPTKTLDLVTKLYSLKRAKRADGSRFGDILFLDQVRAFADVAPQFGKVAPNTFQKTSSIQLASEFWLNTFFTKDFYYAITRAEQPYKPGMQL